MQQTDWHALKVEDCAKLLKTSVEGLADEAAKERLQSYGLNRLTEGDRKSFLALFLGQFRDFMVLVLLAATLISGLLGEFTDAITIIAIIVVNGILGFFQEMRAERSLASLRQLTAPTAHVMRAGHLVTIAAEEVVLGDVISIEAGDRVPADARIMSCRGFETIESSLTGESLPVAKVSEPIELEQAPLGDRRNMLYMGTLATRGQAKAVVVATGMATEMGKIASLIQQSEDVQTPLQRRLEQLGKVLVFVALAITAVVVVTGILHGHEIYEMFLAGVSLAVAAIPEGLPAIVTIALALGVQRMIKRRAIVRKLPSVETLGCATVICSDKTGTLTQNEMTVQQVWTASQAYIVEGIGYVPTGRFLAKGRACDPLRKRDLRTLLQVAVLCNNAQLEATNNGESWSIQGDPTEGAMLALAGKAGLWRSDIDKEWDRVDELAFDSARKMMSVVTRDPAGGWMIGCKGAPDVLLSKCDYLLIDGQPISMTATAKKQIMAAAEVMGKQALRCLGVAYRHAATMKLGEECEQGLVFAGFVGMIDPPRPEVFEAIRTCRRAGIKTIMITGDHQSTAEAIARQLGLMDQRALTVTGAELEAMSDAELEKRVDRASVYARVSPEHKLRIVRALQAKGHVVAMTGDGVNDAPAIKAADIGVAMGQGGTDVAKEASALILSDDNFATIVAAIEEGRGIYDNIRKFVRYLLASNVGEIITMFLAMLMGMPLPLIPVQILWVNLVTDGLPAIALGVDPAEDGIMRRPPRRVQESIFARGLGWKIITRGCMIGIMTLAVFAWSLHQAPDALQKAQTMAFATLVMAQLIHVFDCRNVNGSIFSRSLFGNLWLISAVLSSIGLLAVVMYVPSLQLVFKTLPLGLMDWVIVLAAAAIPTFALEARRKTRRTLRALSTLRG